MAKSVNKVILIGNLGKDPEIRYTPSGTAVANFTLATNERYKDKEGNWQDRTEWHNLVAFARTAEIVGEYLKKGRTVYIEGSLRTNSWEDKQTNQKKYRTEIMVNDLVLLGGGQGHTSGDDAGGGQRSRGTAAGGSGNSMNQPTPDYEGATQITDDDIPF